MIDFDQLILNADGKPLKRSEEDDRDATLASICSTAMFAAHPDDVKIEPAKKADIGALGLRLYVGGPQELSQSEKVLVKDRVGKIYPPLIVARVFEILG